MPSYRYIALDKKGGEVSGVLEAPSMDEALNELKLSGLFIVELKDDVDNKQRLISYLGYLNPRRYKKVKTADLLLFFRQMSLMLRSGHTVVRSLESVAKMIKRHRLKVAVERMATNIQGGMNFSTAMAVEKHIFPDIAVSLIESGEATGEIDKVLDRLSQDLEKTMEIKRKLVSSLTYPIIVIIASVAVILFLVLGVVPKFATFLEGKGAELPASTQALMDMSEWMQLHGFTVLVITLTVIFLTLAAYTQPKGKFWIDRIILRVPAIGGSIIAASMAKTGWTLSMVLSSGVTVLDSIKIASAINGNSLIKRSFDLAAEGVVQGNKFADSLQQEAIPDMVLFLVASGEESGELGTVFLEIGDFYHKELDANINAMTAMIEPALTLMVGGMVGFVYVSFFQAVFAVSTGGM